MVKGYLNFKLLRQYFILMAIGGSLGICDLRLMMYSNELEIQCSFGTPFGKRTLFSAFYTPPELLFLLKIIHTVFIGNNNIRFAILIHIFCNELYSNSGIIINEVALPYGLVVPIFQ